MSVGVSSVEKDALQYFVTKDIPASQLKSTSRAETLAPLPPVCRTLRRPFTKPERGSASPATQATSCTVTPPSPASPDTRRSGIALHLPAEVNSALFLLTVVTYRTSNRLFFVAVVNAKTYLVCKCNTMHHYTTVQILTKLQLCLL